MASAVAFLFAFAMTIPCMCVDPGRVQNSVFFGMMSESYVRIIANAGQRRGGRAEEKGSFHGRFAATPVCSGNHRAIYSGNGS
jgi:hypothetical protein